MNLSKAINSLKLSLGLYQITLPFKNENTGELTPTENVIRDVITTTTIPIFSQFSPWVKELEASLNTLQVVNKERGIYMLPKMLCTTPIYTIHSIELPMYRGRGEIYGDIMTSGYSTTYGGIGRATQDVLTATASAMLVSQIKAQPSFEYLGENKVRLYGFPRTVLKFKVSAEHEPNGESIPPTCYESFMKLATLDMKVFLYNTLKLYDNISSAFGPVQLKIEDYSSADGERTALLNDWTEVFHLDNIDWIQFM